MYDLPPYDPALSRVDSNRNNNQTQKLLAFSMRSRDSGMGKRTMTPTINSILGVEAAKEGTVGGLDQEYQERRFRSQDFPLC
jgi:hypothetical protein